MLTYPAIDPVALQLGPPAVHWYGLAYLRGFWLFLLLGRPLKILMICTPGMSFHGGLLGVVAAMLWFAHSRKRPWLQVADFVAPCVPPGLAAGRGGNLINGGP